MKGQPFKRLFGVLKNIAPTLLAGVSGPLAPLALTIAKKALGSESMTDDALEEAVSKASGTTEGLAQLRQIEADLQKAELEHEFKFSELEVDDRKDARARQIALKDTMPAQVFYLTSLGFFGALIFMFVRGIPATGGEALLLMLGSLGTAWGASVAYFVGSSAGSRQKTEILAKQ